MAWLRCDVSARLGACHSKQRQGLPMRAYCRKMAVAVATSSFGVVNQRQRIDYME